MAIWIMKLGTANAPYHVIYKQGVSINHIFGIIGSILPIHYITFMGLR